MNEQGVKTKDWKQWIKDNKRRNRKCDKYFPTISVEEGQVVIMVYNIIIVITLYFFKFPAKSFEN